MNTALHQTPLSHEEIDASLALHGNVLGASPENSYPVTTIESVDLEVSDPALARAFYADALGLEGQIRLRPSDAPTNGFRGFTLSLKVAQPADVDLLVEAAVDAGAAAVKPVKTSLWGYGGTLRAPDGTIWTVASSAKRNTARASRRVEDVVLLLGATDVAASKRFYVERGLTVARSFGRKYVEFDTGPSAVKLALYGRRALAKTAGVDPDGTGSHRLVVANDAATFTDPDGFVWEAVSTRENHG